MSEERFENGEYRPGNRIRYGNMQGLPESPGISADDSAFSREQQQLKNNRNMTLDESAYRQEKPAQDSLDGTAGQDTAEWGSREPGTGIPEETGNPGIGSPDTPGGPDLIMGRREYAGGTDASGSTSAGYTPGPASGEGGGRGRYYSYGRGPASPSYPGNGKTPARKKKRGVLIAVLAVVLVFIIGAGAGAYATGRRAKDPARLKGTVQEDRSSADNQESSPEAEKKTQEKETSSKEETPSGDKKSTSSKEDVPRIRSAENAEGSSDTGVADVAEKVMPAIVSVYNKYTQEAQFFGRQYTQEGQSTGSGIIIGQTDEELLIVTNNHVVEGADSLSVQFINEENCEALLKGTDAGSDLAVISVPLADLNAETTEAIAIAELGSSDDLRIGEPAIAIGNALGYGQSLTVGYISALNREITAEDGITGTFIQTDAAINPGNSGGALLNSSGQVIGINSNKIGGSAIEGMGFAIPISKALPIIEQLKTQESKTKVAEEEQGALGILGISVTSDVASAYGLPVGAYVEEVIEGSAAEQSDLSQGDIITAINGQTINGMEALQNQLAYYKAGEEVTLTVQHPMEGGSYEEREITLTLSKRSDIQGSGNPRGRDSWQQEMPYEQEEGEGFFDFPFGGF